MLSRWKRAGSSDWRVAEGSLTFSHDLAREAADASTWSCGRAVCVLIRSIWLWTRVGSLQVSNGPHLPEEARDAFGCVVEARVIPDEADAMHDGRQGGGNVHRRGCSQGRARLLKDQEELQVVLCSDCLVLE